MTFQARHGWMAERIRETFKDVPEKEIDSFMQSSGVLTHTSSLFSAGGPAKLFVFLEPKDNGTPTLKIGTGSDERLKGRFCYFIRSAPEGKAVDPSKVCDAD
jgi:hypothetical protein